MTISFANCNSCLLLHGIASTFCLAMTSVLRRITSTDKSPSRNDGKEQKASSRDAKRRGDLMVMRALIIAAGDYVDGQKSVS